jgi:hypothetical protein
MVARTVVAPFLVTASGMMFVMSVARMRLIIVIHGRRIMGDRNARPINWRRDDDRWRVNNSRLMDDHSRARQWRQRRQWNADADVDASWGKPQACG